MMNGLRGPHGPVANGVSAFAYRAQTSFGAVADGRKPAPHAALDAAEAWTGW